MSDRNFFAELKRRNVVRMAGLYLVGAWLLTQVASTVLPMFGTPDWLPRSIVILLAIGFLPALIFSWVFEVTPEGLKRDADVPPEKSIAPQTARRMDRMIIVVLVLALGYFMVDKFFLASRRAAAPGELSSVASAPSIAVLPFENLSEDKGNAYFAEGIQDEILTRLSKISALKVISRTSTQKYKSAPDNLREVGKQLGVANLLEGSVQKIGTAVHINVQLIRVATDEHLWAESYNRKLDDIFAVEGEVAGAIAEALNAKLTGAEKAVLTEKPTQNVGAYEAYLRGISIEHSQYGYDVYTEAARNYAQAVQLDPNFALAWARLAVVRSFLFFNSVDSTTNSPAAVKEAADRAMSLAPDAGESWLAQGAYRYRVLRDFEGAVTPFKRAGTLLPNNSYVLRNLAFVLRRAGRWQEAETEYNKALQLDPRDVSLLVSMGGEFYNYLRRFDDAHAVIDRALAISPDLDTAHALKAYIFQSQDRLPEAAQELARIPNDASDDYIISTRLVQALYERHFDTAIDVVERKLRTIPPEQPIDSVVEDSLVKMGFCQEWMGRHEDARRAFTRVVERIKPTPQTVVLPEANGVPCILALAYAGLGEKDKALQQAQQAVKDYDSDGIIKPLVALPTLAQVQAHFGDVESAIALLPHLLEAPAGITRADLKFNPLWDPLRQDPRFEKLCQEPKK
jgi:TolB-like protein/Tfp pilus assembly protein PilF